MRHISIRRKTAEMVPSKKMDEGRNMAEIKLKKREEMDPAYCWDLSSLFGSDEEFEKTEQPRLFQPVCLCKPEISPGYGKSEVSGLCRKDGQHDGCSCGCLFFRRAGDPGA